MHWLGSPAFVATLLLWEPCFFCSSMSFVERWERFAAVRQLGRALEGWERIALAIKFWSSCSIFGCGTYASGWERHTYSLLNEKWSSHYESMCASRRGQIIQMWRKIVRRAFHRAYWKRYERIGLFIMQAQTSVLRRKIGKSHRTSYEYWKLLELIFPGADQFRAGRLWCL